MALTSTAAGPTAAGESLARSSAAAWMLAVAAYVLIAVYATWPLPRVASDHLVSNFSPEDILLHTWNLSWDVHALLTNPRGLFEANILHPAPNTLALSEHLLGQLPLFAPVWLLTGNPVLALNANTFLTFVLAALFAHFVVLRWTGSSAAAWVAGIGFAFAPWRFTQFHWPQLFAVQYFPLVLYATHRAATSRRLAWGWAAGALIALQMLCSYYLAYMVVVLVGCYVVADVVFRGWRGRRGAWSALAAAAVVPAAVVVPLSLPYLGARRAGTLAWGEGAPVVERFLAAVGHPALVLRTYVGWGVAALAATAVFALVEARRRRDRDAATLLAALIAVAVLSFGIAVGPAGLLGGWFAPYAWLSSVVPGFSMVRGPARFGMLANFALAVLAALGVASLRRVIMAGGWRVAARFVAAGAILAASLPLWTRIRPRTIPVPTGNDVPPVYRWLAENAGGGALLELPVTGERVKTGTKACKAEAMAMYYSTYHWLPLLNGYSGYVPDSYPTLMQRAARLPDPTALRTLVSCADLRWILIREANPQTRRQWDAQDSVRFRGAFERKQLGRFAKRPPETDLLYEVLLAPGGRCPLELAGKESSRE